MLVKQQGVNRFFRDDAVFNSLYPMRIQVKALPHWTPVEVAECASIFLAPENNVHVLDIGSGVGKFCLAAAHRKPNAEFYGVEQRRDLVEFATRCSASMSWCASNPIQGMVTANRVCCCDTSISPSYV